MGRLIKTDVIKGEHYPRKGTPETLFFLNTRGKIWGPGHKTQEEALSYMSEHFENHVKKHDPYRG